MVPLVAAITLPRGQKLGMVLDDGLRLRLFAYRRIKVSVMARLTRKTAKRLHIHGRPRVAARNYDFAQRGVYGLRLRLTPRVIERLRHQRRAGLLLRTVLTDAKSSTTATTPITLRR
jgi:hypothetical protein